MKNFRRVFLRIVAILNCLCFLRNTIKGWLFLSSKMVLIQVYFLTLERKTFYSNAFHLLDGVDDLFQPSLFLSNVVVSSWFSTLMRFIRELFGVGAGSKKSWKLLCCFL